MEVDLTPDELPLGLYQSPYFFLLESSLSGPEARWTIAAWDPTEVYRFNFEPGQEDPFKFLGRQPHNTPQPPLTLRGGLPFSGGWIGYLGYELYSLLEKKVPARKSNLIPAAVFAHYDQFYVYDHSAGKGWVVSNVDTTGGTTTGPVTSENFLSRFACSYRAGRRLGRLQKVPLVPPVDPNITNVQSNFTSPEYLTTVAKIKDYIAAGDVYQVNLSQQFSAKTEASPYEIYQRLRGSSPAPYSAFLNLGEAQILSASPECFLHVDQGIVTTRPIKGTRPRGNTPEQDTRLREELTMSPKDRAELMMIVDLERNDLGKVCQPGSVKTTTPIGSVESFPQVHHLVATIQGKLSPNKKLADLLCATFPGGSITGAPKIRAMEIIRELEPHGRGIYTGAIGFIDTSGRASFNIAIRTMVFKGGTATFWAGGGIVADSDPAEEYEETLVKAKGIMESL